MNQDTHFSGQPILAQLMAMIPRSAVERLARRHRSDHYYKQFKTYDHLVTMMYAVFSRCTSIREVVTGMLASKRRLEHVGRIHLPRRSTLADANRRRDYRVFEALHGYLYRRYAHVLPDSRSQDWVSKLYIVDSTTISLFQAILKNAGRPALNGKRKGGVKAHTLIKADEDVPRLVRLTSGATNDRTFMKLIDLPRGSIVAFDRGYNHYQRFNEWTEAGIDFVTRVHSNAIWECLQEHPVSDEERLRGVILDQVVEFGHSTHPHKVKARRVVFADPQGGRPFEFLTNNQTMSPSTIAQIYARRWQIELLFKRLKQNFPLQYFLGDNANAIKLQIWCALIADLLLNVVRAKSKRLWAFANLVSMVRLHLTTYINLASFLNDPEKALRRRNTEIDLQMSLFPT